MYAIVHFGTTSRKEMYFACPSTSMQIEREDLDKLMCFHRDFSHLQRRNATSIPDMHQAKAFNVHYCDGDPFSCNGCSSLHCSYLHYTRILVFIDAKVSHFT